MKIHVHAIAMVLFLTATVLDARSASVSSDEAAAKIDQLIAAKLVENKLTPNPVTPDDVFVRRLYLDLTGRIPTKRETLNFLESNDPDKRAALVDSLIGSDGYVSHFYNYFSNLLRTRTSISGNGQSVGAGHAYEGWIKDAIRGNKPYDDFVRELVTASGASWENPATGYYLRDYGMPLDNLAITTQVFLGTQIVCAQCHDHPFDSWTQMDYYHLSAFTYGMMGTGNHPVVQKAMQLASGGADAQGKGKGKGKGKAKGKGKPADTDTGEPVMMAGNGYTGKSNEAALRRASSEILFPLRFNNILESDRALRLPKDYQYDDARPLSVVNPATPFGPDAPLSESGHPVHAFGDWLTSPENPRFTKVIVNRLWKRAFGLGIVEPVDDFREHTVIPNPELMTALEELMISLDYDLQAFQRILYKTQAYQREASLEEPVPGAPYYFAGPILRRMSAEQIWDSLVAMTVEEPDLPDAEREVAGRKRHAAVQLIAESVYDQTPAEFLRHMREVVRIQGELSERIEAAQAQVTAAREKGDPDLIKQASLEARKIKDELDTRIEEIVYRDGLERKLAEVTGKGQAERASVSTREERPSVTSAGGDDLIVELAAALFEGDRSFEEGMESIVGSEGNGIVKQLVDAMFAERERELQSARDARRATELAAWKVAKQPEVRAAYRGFDKQIRERMKRASELNQPAPAGHFLREFGQSDRELVENSSDEASITQALAMLNGPALAAVTNRFSVLMRDMRGEKFEERLDTVYLTMLSRLPTDGEKAVFREAWAADPESGTVNGIVWTLLNTRQFLFVQ